MFGLRDGGLDGWVGIRAKKFVYLKWASWLAIQNFIFPSRQICLVLGGWWFALGAL